MNLAHQLPIPFPPIHRHGVIGDRRTGTLVAADGTLNWFCVPNFDGSPLFGALLDPKCGGFCRFGPSQVSLGKQHYLSETAAVVTSWNGIRCYSRKPNTYGRPERWPGCAEPSKTL
jgi:Domain of unknown function (DUF5911)